MIRLGDKAPDSAFSFFFSTQHATGAPITLAGTPSLAVYKDASTTEITAGLTLTVGFDGVVGRHRVAVHLSADAGYEGVGDYSIVLAAGTVDGVSVANRTFVMDVSSLGIGPEKRVAWDPAWGQPMK